MDFSEMKRKLDKAMEIIDVDLKAIKAGRAKPDMISEVKIEAYPGVYNNLIELASITAPDPHLLNVQPWDKTILKKVEEGLQKAGLNLNPVIDGDHIRIAVPPLTEETRMEKVKQAKQKIESGKNMMRDIRGDVKRDIDEQKGQSGVSEDDIASWISEMQKIFDEYMTKMDTLLDAKEKELMEI